jgi:hypothetical protein
MAQTVAGAVAKFVLKDFFGSIIGFPVWWFTRGFVYFAGVYSRTLKGFANQFAVGVWVKNIFVPMYGSYDWSGRIISFFVRVAQIIVRGFVMLLITIVLTTIFLAWIALPVVATVALFAQIAGLFA